MICVSAYIDAANGTKTLKYTVVLVGVINADTPTDSVSYLFPVGIYNAGDDYDNAKTHLENHCLKDLRELQSGGITFDFKDTKGGEIKGGAGDALRRALHTPFIRSPRAPPIDSHARQQRAFDALIVLNFSFPRA